MADATIDSVDLTASPSMQTKMPCSDGTGAPVTISVEQILALAPAPEPGAAGDDGTDGIGVASVSVNGSGHLIITYTDNSTHDAGYAVGPAGTNGSNGTNGTNGISITSVAINGSNHLIVTLSTGSTIDAGALPSGGGTGDMLASVYDSDGDGHISYNDLEDKPTLGTAAAANIAAFEPAGAASIAVAAILDAAPATLDTLNKLAAALGDDPNFAATITAALAGKQATLVSGTNIKTINGTSVLGSGDIEVTGGSGGASVQQTAVTLAQNASTNITATAIINVYESLSNVSVVPVMSSNTTPSGIATSSAIWGTSNDTYKAFDGNDSTYFSPLVIGQNFLAYQFPGALNITSYSIKGNDLTYSPSSWTLEGSNDGINWTILHTVTNNTSYVSGYIFTVSSPGLYTNYKLNMSASRNPAGGPNVYTLEFYAGVFNLLTKTDYNVSRGTANGIQTHTITRLKTGTASMVIDYI